MNLFKRIISFSVIIMFLAFASGCALIGAAVSAGVAYGLYQVTKK